MERNCADHRLQFLSHGKRSSAATGNWRQRRANFGSGRSAVMESGDFA
jgi:hypothetical protein